MFHALQMSRPPIVFSTKDAGVLQNYGIEMDVFIS